MLQLKPQVQPRSVHGSHQGSHAAVAPLLRERLWIPRWRLGWCAGAGMAIALSSSTPTLAQSTDLEQRLLDLEMRQQELMEEIEFLRGQLSDVQDGDVEPVQELQTTEETDAVKNSQRPQGLSLSAEVLFLDPRISEELDFAIIDPGEALAVSGDLASLDYDLTTDVRYGVGYRIGNVDLQAHLLSISSKGESSAERPDGGFLFTTLTSPVQNDSAETAEAETQLDFDTVDLELGYGLQANENLDFRLFAGLRFADIDQDMAIAYDGGDFTESEVEMTQDFSGFGPRIGGDVRWLMGSGFSAFGRASGSLLIGDSRTRYRETDNSGEDLVAELERKNGDHLIPVAELALGLDWAGQFTETFGGNISVGYEYQNWFNAYNTSRFVDDSSPGLLTEQQGDVSFQGFFVKTGISLDF